MRRLVLLLLLSLSTACSAAAGPASTQEASRSATAVARESPSPATAPARDAAGPDATLARSSPAPGADSAPDPTLAAYLEGVRRREAGDFEAAVEPMERAHALAPDDPDLTLELARTYEAARYYGAAAAAYAEALQIAPTRADLALAQARFHLDHAFRVRDALPAAELAARLRPNDPDTIRLLDRARAAAALAGR